MGVEVEEKVPQFEGLTVFGMISHEVYSSSSLVCKAQIWQHWPPSPFTKQRRRGRPSLHVLTDGFYFKTPTLPSGREPAYWLAPR